MNLFLSLDVFDGGDSGICCANVEPKVQEPGQGDLYRSSSFELMVKIAIIDIPAKVETLTYLKNTEIASGTDHEALFDVSASLCYED